MKLMKVYLLFIPILLLFCIACKKEKIVLSCKPSQDNVFSTKNLLLGKWKQLQYLEKNKIHTLSNEIIWIFSEPLQSNCLDSLTCQVINLSIFNNSDTLSFEFPHTIYQEGSVTSIMLGGVDANWYKLHICENQFTVSNLSDKRKDNDTKLFERIP